MDTLEYLPDQVKKRTKKENGYFLIIFLFG